MPEREGQGTNNYGLWSFLKASGYLSMLSNCTCNVKSEKTGKTVRRNKGYWNFLIQNTVQCAFQENERLCQITCQYLCTNAAKPSKFKQFNFEENPTSRNRSGKTLLHANGKGGGFLQKHRCNRHSKIGKNAGVLRKQCRGKTKCLLEIAKRPFIEKSLQSSDCMRATSTALRKLLVIGEISYQISQCSKWHKNRKFSCCKFNLFLFLSLFSAESLLLILREWI